MYDVLSKNSLYAMGLGIRIPTVPTCQLQGLSKKHVFRTFFYTGASALEALKHVCKSQPHLT